MTPFRLRRRIPLIRPPFLQRVFARQKTEELRTRGAEHDALISRKRTQVAERESGIESETQVSPVETLKSEIDYETHARACDPKDFQSQVLRTPNGKPVGQDQVDWIIDAIAKGIAIAPDDVVLDLCCGNGAITDPILARCRGGVGVDRSPYLISVANANFERPPDRLYRLSDALEYVQTTADTDRITKVMCYGAFQCLPEETAAGVLLALRRRFPRVQRVFIGNLPDLSRAGIFWRELGSEPWSLHDLKRHDTHFGTWRTEDEVTKIATASGWCTEISRMPAAYFAAAYRFDAILTPL